MRVSILAALALSLSGCASWGWSSAAPGVALPPFRGDVEILAAAPAGALRVGRVRGVERFPFSSAEDDARALAAKIGADVLVVDGRGEVLPPLVLRSVPFVDAEAFRASSR